MPGAKLWFLALRNGFITTRYRNGDSMPYEGLPIIATSAVDPEDSSKKADCVKVSVDLYR